MKWKSFEFNNIQSWENGKINLSLNGLTVIEAKSETGKSVFIKCLRLGLYFEQYDAKTRKAIIRNYPENSYGDFKITLEDNTQICFRFTSTAVITVVGYPDGTAERIERSDIHKVAKMLNLITCADSLRILNILDNESPMLYDTTDMEYNTKIMSLYLDHEDLRHRKELAREFITRLTATEKNVKYLYTEYSERLRGLQTYCDVNEVDSLISYCKELNGILNIYDKAEVELQYVSAIKQRSTTDLEGLEYVINQLHDLENIESNLAYVTTIKSKPVIDDEIFNRLSEILNDITLYESVHKALQDVILFSKEKPTVDTVKLEKMLLTFTDLTLIEEALITLVNSLDYLIISKNDLAKTTQDLEKFKQENKTCPLCGQIWVKEL